VVGVTRLWDRLIKRDYWEGQASGAAVLTTTYGSADREAILPQVTAWAQQANASTSPVFAAILVRMMLLSEAQFQLQAKDDKHLYGNTSLAVLEHPYEPDSTSGELIARNEQDASVAGNAYTWAPPGEGRLVRLRPDWTTIISERVAVGDGGWYRKKLGYWHEPPKTLIEQGQGFLAPAEEVAHWAPITDPQATFRGMSWLTPVMRDVQGDEGLSAYKLRYLSANATPNLVIKYAQKLQPATVDAIRERMTARYGGPDNAGKTLILDQGADLVAVGNSLSDMDFSSVQQAGIERILAAGGVPPLLIGLESIKGAGKSYQEVIRRFGDLTLRPLWRSLCGALEPLVPGLPAGSRLWVDTADIAALQDGEQVRAQVTLIRAQALLALQQAGYDRMSAVKAIEAGDMGQLEEAAVPPPPSNLPVQHLLGQPGQPGATADPLPPTMPRLPVGSTSPGDGGNNTRPTPRPASARRGEPVGANGRG
jgi:phage portal protein BeeE